jgi:hypothetical protein
MSEPATKAESPAPVIITTRTLSSFLISFTARPISSQPIYSRHYEPQVDLLLNRQFLLHVLVLWFQMYSLFLASFFLHPFYLPRLSIHYSPLNSGDRFSKNASILPLYLLLSKEALEQYFRNVNL